MQGGHRELGLGELTQALGCVPLLESRQVFLCGSPRYPTQPFLDLRDEKLCFHPQNGKGLVEETSSDTIPVGCCSRSKEAHVIDGIVSPQNSCSPSLRIWP